MNWVIFQACKITEPLNNLTKHFYGRTQFQIGILNLFTMEPRFRYHKMLKVLFSDLVKCFTKSLFC